MHLASAGRSRTGRQKSCCPRRSSRTASLPFLNKQVGSWKNAISKYLAGTGLEVRPCGWHGSIRDVLRRDPAQHTAALAQLNHLSFREPFFQLARVPELAKIDARHRSQCGTNRDTTSTLRRITRTAAPRPAESAPPRPMDTASPAARSQSTLPRRSRHQSPAAQREGYRSSTRRPRDG